MSIPPPPPDDPWALVIAHDPREGDRLAALIAEHRPVRSVTRIAECLRILATHPSVKMVCVDLDLPAGAGVLLARAIRAERRYDHVDVVAFGGDDAADHVAAIRAGVSRCLTAPVRAKSIEGLVRRTRRSAPPRAA
ncbi:MAG: response regulator transcription factor [Sandaracinaceae bacterium]|nr:response regulator transcription factor [Sandaracinaceae bacterium]